MLFFLQKVAQRKAELKTMSFRSENAKKQWIKVMTPEYMSSDESGMEEDDDTLVIHYLSWRAKAVNDLFKYLDDRIWTKKSALARRQTRKRVVSSTPSSRPQPSSSPDWAIV